MSVAKRAPQVVHFPLDKIAVINPRSRNRKTFETIVRNIRQLGLKRPITVMPRRGGSSDEYNLVCGQGRLEAFIALGGNLGDVRATFDSAIAILCDGPEVRLMARSSETRSR